MARWVAWAALVWVCGFLILGGGQTGLAAANQAVGRLQPLLVQMSAEDPGRMVRVIVQKERNAAGIEEAAQRLGGRDPRSFPFIRAFSVAMPVARLASLAAANGVRYISFDAPVRLAAVDTNAVATAYPFSAAADDSWATGYSGRGVTVAVIDTGISANGVTGGQGDFADRIKARVAVHPDATDGEDRFGHGTHVAGIIAGDGALVGGRYVGIAPGAHLVSVKASDDQGGATEANLIDALQWVYDNHAAYGIRVVNLSANSTVAASYKTSPLAAAVEQLWLNGITVVVAAGNRGESEDGVYYPPANDPYVITVGAVSDAQTTDRADDAFVSWSSWGLTQDEHPKPEVMAPGSRIVSTLSGADPWVARQYPTAVVDDHYLRMGGTSMAAPVVAGTVALMLEADPTLTPDQIKWVLKQTSRSYVDQPAGAAGVVVAGAAARYSQQLVPQSANEGLQPAAFVDPETGEIDWDTALWQTAVWQTAVWQNIEPMPD